jgi:hypothetical protein
MDLVWRNDELSSASPTAMVAIANRDSVIDRGGESYSSFVAFCYCLLFSLYTPASRYSTMIFVPARLC